MRPTDRRAFSILAWVLVLCGLTLSVSHAANLKYVQEVVWPTDIHAFQHMETGPIDVALIGSSRTTFGLAPTAIDACLGREIGRSATTYNLSRVFSSMFTEQGLFRELLVGEKVPEVVVVEVAPEILMDRHHEHTYNMETQASLADLPECLRSVRTVDDLVACARAPLRGIENIALLLEGDYRDVNHLTWMMRYHRGGQFCFGSRACDDHNAAYATRLEPRWRIRVHRILPTVTATRFGSSRVGEGQGHRALLELIGLARDRGVRLVLLNMPVHQRYQDEIPPEADAAYRDYLDEIAETYGVLWYDANTPAWRGDRESFQDADHLDAEGALKLSTELCTEVLAPMLRPGGTQNWK